MKARIFKKCLICAVAAVMAGSLGWGNPAAAASGNAEQAADGGLFKIKVGQQPQRWGLEWYIASQKGWWKEVGLEPTMVTFSSGAPEIAAGASGSWDVGGAGNIPSLLGAARYGLQTIGIADGEAAIITLMATKDKADAYLKNHALIKGKTIPVTTNSTGQWGATECLKKKFGMGPNDYRYVNLSPPEINAAVSSGRYDLSEVWAPNTYILESTIGAKVICTGAEMGMPIASYLFTAPAFAKEHPEIVAKFLAVYLRAVAWQHAHSKETVQYLGEFFKQHGVNIPEKYLPVELHDRPAYELADQVKIFKPDASGKATIDDWWNQVGEFMVSVGTIRKVPDVKTHVSNKYLTMIENDPNLKAFAENKGD